MLSHARDEKRAGSLGTQPQDSLELQEACNIIQVAARCDRPVLIVGEPGTGKELVAHAIHSTSDLASLPFTSLECRTLGRNELARELSITIDNVERKTSADHGTLFLAEIVDLGLESQAILLRALQEAEEEKALEVSRRHPRIIASSQVDVRTAVASGRFRRDLYHRLDTLSLRIPPLRERRGDIPFLVENYLNRYFQRSGRCLRVSDDAQEVLGRYDWPGNIREFEECLQRACQHCLGLVVYVEDLPSKVLLNVDVSEYRYISE